MSNKTILFRIFTILFVSVAALAPAGASAASGLVLTDIFPTTKIAGDSAFTLTLTGENFDANSIAVWNGAGLTTTYIDSTELTAQVPAAYVLSAGVAEVAVGSLLGGDPSAAVLFTIITPPDNAWMAHSPEGGWINNLAIDPGNTTTLYAGTAHSGVFKSVNSGESWTAINNGLPGPYIDAIAASSSSPAVVLAAVNGAGLYRSSDGGAFWSQATQTGATAVAFDPQNPQIAYEANKYIYRSADGGVSWAPANTTDFLGAGSTDVYDLVPDPSHSGTLYITASGLNKVWKSTNFGVDWTAKTNGLPAQLSLRALAISPSQPDILYVGTEYNASMLDQVGLYRSGDGGESWTRVSSEPVVYLKIAVNPQNPHMLYLATSGGVYQSIDDGASLQSVLIESASTLAIDPTSTSVVYMAGSRGIFGSTDAGASWRPLHNGLYAQLITSLITDPQNTSTLFAGTWTGGVWKSSDSGINWAQSSADPPYIQHLTIDPHDSNHLYLDGPSIWESKDGGHTWAYTQDGFSIAFAANSDLYMGANGAMKKSINGGKDWLDVSNGLPVSDTVRGLVPDPKDPNTIYAFNATDLYKTVDGGQNWVWIKNNASIPWVSCYTNMGSCLAIDPMNTSVLYLTEGMTPTPLFYKSVDGGSTWTAININQGYLQLNTVVVDPTYDTVVYLGTEKGAFISKDGGLSWESFNSGLNSPLVRALLALPQTPPAGSRSTGTGPASSPARTFSVVGGTVYAYSGNPILPTFKSASAYDGWILETSRTSSAGGAINATSKTFQLGDDALNRQYRAILSFNTLNLPDNAVISSARLRIRQSGKAVGSNPFNILGGLLVDVRKGTFGTAALQPRDFQALPTVYKAGIFSKTAVNGWYSVTLNAAGLRGINKAGITQFRLYFTKGDNNDLGADFMRFFSGNNATDKPELIITYTIP